MARLLTCLRNHQWELPAAGPAPDTVAHCPVCGAGVAQPPPEAAAAETPPSRPGPAVDSAAEPLTIPPSPPAAEALSDRVAVPGYEVRGELGRGGMGVVYRARHLRLNRLVALKMILSGAHAGEQDLARFRAEAEAVARLQHPNIVQIYEVGEHQGLPYCALEFCPGGSLAARLAGTPLLPAAAAQISETLARAVHAAHQAGVVHRDLKPANVLLVPSDRPEAVALGGDPGKPERFEPKVTDFGLAKRLDVEGAGQTQSGAILGTPSYMAPEQAAGQSKEIGPAADTYALGAVLYELLTGRPPFRAATPLDTLLQVLSDEPVPPGRLNAGVPRDLETVCLKCLHKEPAKRYGSALELAEDLRRVRQGEPIRARPVGRLERAARWARRNPVVAGSLAAVVLVLVAGTAVSTAFGVAAVAARASLETANANLTAERDRTQAALEAEARRRRQAREALDAMSSRVIDDWLAKQKELTAAHKKFLEQALASYEEFAQDTGQDEPARAGVAAAYLRVGNIRWRLGQFPEAEEAFRTSQERYAQLVADFPAVPDYRQELAVTHENLGVLLKDTGRGKEAEGEYRQARDLQQHLVNESPGVPGYRERLAGCHCNLGALLHSAGRAQDAEGELRQALDLDQRLADDFPAVPDYRQELATTHNNLGILLQDTGHAREAEGEYRQALVLFQRLAEDFPASPVYGEGLAAGHNSLGIVFARSGRTPEAAGEFRQALDLYRQLADDFPAVPEYRRELARGHNNLGLMLRRTGRAQEAEEEYRRALALKQRLAHDFPAVPDYQNEVAGSLVNLARLVGDRQDFVGARRLLEEALPYHRAALKANPRHPAYRDFYRNNAEMLADILLHLGAHADAAAAADQLAERAVDPPNDLYNAACFLARCVPLAEKDGQLPATRQKELARDYADRALAVLRQAVEKGYKDVANMEKDPDLNPLRQRDDFRRLLAGLEKPKPGGK
jgi:tetratricopeptide (TPR) repeat protein